MKDQSCKTPRWQFLKRQLNNLSPQDFLSQIIHTPQAMVIDVRTATEFATGHFPRAMNIDYLSADFWDRVEQLDAKRPIFVYCRTGRRSIRACTLMRNGGFDNSRLYNMDGGYAQWLLEQASAQRRSK